MRLEHETEDWGKAIYSAKRRTDRGKQQLHEWRMAYSSVQDGAHTITDLYEIVDYLNLLSRPMNSEICHTFMPTAGGLDFTKAEVSIQEPGCVELYFSNVPDVVRPAHLLIYKNPNHHAEWWHMRLRTAKLEPEFEETEGPNEEGVRLADGTLLRRHHWDEDYMYDQHGAMVNLPTDSQLIGRHLKPDCFFTFFAKQSLYNFCNITYLEMYANIAPRRFEASIAACEALTSPYLNYEERALQDLRGDCQQLAQDEALLRVLRCITHSRAAFAHNLYVEQIEPYAVDHLRQLAPARLESAIADNFVDQEASHLRELLGL